MKKIKEFLNIFYLKIFKTDDTPHKISLGFSIGLALGILPGTGPLAALIFASLLHANRASALLGSIITNTWFSIVIIVPALKIGRIFLSLNGLNTYDNKLNFYLLNWKSILTKDSIKIILSIILGYAIISLGIGIITYFLFRVLLKITEKYGSKS